MGSLLDEPTKDELVNVIGHADPAHIDYEKFNRLCDTYFYMPG